MAWLALLNPALGEGASPVVLPPHLRMVVVDPPGTQYNSFDLYEPADLRRLADALDYDILGGGA